MTRMVSPIYGMGPSGETASERMGRAAARVDRLRADCWLRLGVAVLDPAEIADEWTRQIVINEATRQYGQRGT